MKKLLLMIAAGGVLFTACDKKADCGHEFIEHDYTQELVGTWTCLDMDYAEALVSLTNVSSLRWGYAW